MKNIDFIKLAHIKSIRLSIDLRMALEKNSTSFSLNPDKNMLTTEYKDYLQNLKEEIDELHNIISALYYYMEQEQECQAVNKE